MKSKIALTAFALLFSTVSIASQTQNLESDTPFEHEKKLYKNKLMEKSASKRQYIDQDENILKTNFINRIDPRLETAFNNMNSKRATEIFYKEDANPNDILISGLFFYNSGKYQNMPIAIQQFYKGYLNKDPASTYLYALMTIKGEGIHQNTHQGIELLKSVKGDERFETLAAMKLSEYLSASGQEEASISALDGIESRDKYYIIGKSHLRNGDKELAFEYFQKAVDSGYREANYEIAKEMLKNDDFELSKVIYLLEEVIDYGTERDIKSQAQILLGDIYFLGTAYNYSNHSKGFVPEI